MAEDVPLCLYTNDDDLLPHLLELYDQLQEAACYLAYSGEGEEEK